jgi:murein peptide amidase A
VDARRAMNPKGRFTADPAPRRFPSSFHAISMQRLGKNINRYCGETIDIQQTLEDIERHARENAWRVETFYQSDDLKLIALRRPPPAPMASGSPKVYISTGIHGDEPAGPLAARQLLANNQWPEHLDVWFCPCLNPVGFQLNCRENRKGIDLNREYLKPMAEEITAHIEWLNRQPRFDLCLLLHEDWESQGFYLYEQNPDNQVSLAESIVEQVAKVCPVDRSDLIEGRPAKGGIIRPSADLLRSRTDWPEAFFVITHKTRLSYTLEAPSDFSLPIRVAALEAAVNAALKSLVSGMAPGGR